jgi:hypothetical protein
MMTPAERQSALARLAESRDHLLRTARGLSREQLLYRSDPARWSVAENIEHLVVVENFVVGTIEKLLQQPPDLAKRSPMTDEQLVAQIETVVERAQAPPRALPSSRWPPEELLPEFEKARRRTTDFAAAADGDLRRRFIPHFKFGDLDCYQWLLLLAAHCQRHCAQSEQVEASPGFPR